MILLLTCQKVLQNRRFFAWASRSSFGAAICGTVVHNSVLCFATQRLQIAVENGVRQGSLQLLLCFASGSRASHYIA